MGSVRGPATIRENQAIRANLRIDLRESGHLSPEIVTGFLRGNLRAFRLFTGQHVLKVPRGRLIRAFAPYMHKHLPLGADNITH